MTAEAKKKSVRRNVGSVFALFFLINVVLVVLALVAAFAGKHPFTIFPEDTGSGVRLLVLASGAALSWAIGRWLYVQMLEGEFRPDDSATGAVVLMFYLICFFAGAVFIGPALWVWQVILLAVLILLTFFGLRSVLSAAVAAVVILLCLAAGTALYFMLA